MKTLTFVVKIDYQSRYGDELTSEQTKDFEQIALRKVSNALTFGDLKTDEVKVMEGHIRAAWNM